MVFKGCWWISAQQFWGSWDGLWSPDWWKWPFWKAARQENLQHKKWTTDTAEFSSQRTFFPFLSFLIFSLHSATILTFPYFVNCRNWKKDHIQACMFLNNFWSGITDWIIGCLQNCTNSHVIRTHQVEMCLSVTICLSPCLSGCALVPLLSPYLTASQFYSSFHSIQLS